MANIDKDEGKNHQNEKLEGRADSPGSEYPGNLGEKEDNQSLRWWNVNTKSVQCDCDCVRLACSEAHLEVEIVWIVDQRRVWEDTDQVSCPENKREVRGESPPGFVKPTSVPPLQAAKLPRLSPRRQIWVDFSSWLIPWWRSQWFPSRQTKGKARHASLQFSWLPCSYLGNVQMKKKLLWILNITKCSRHGNHWMFRDPVSHPEVGVEMRDNKTYNETTHAECLPLQERPAHEAMLTTSPPGPPWCRPCFSSNKEHPCRTPSRFIWTQDHSSFSSRTVKTTLDQRMSSTFMQRSKPSMGETPALLTRTSISFWKNFSAAAQTFSHWALSVTSCSSNMQEFSPNLWGKEGMFRSGKVWSCNDGTSWNAWQSSVPACWFLSVRTTLPPPSRTLLLNSFPNPPAAPVIRKVPFMAWTDELLESPCLSLYCLVPGSGLYKQQLITTHYDTLQRPLTHSVSPYSLPSFNKNSITNTNQFYLTQSYDILSIYHSWLGIMVQSPPPSNTNIAI